MDYASIVENKDIRSRLVEAQRTKEQVQVKEETKGRHHKILDENNFKEIREEGNRKPKFER